MSSRWWPFAKLRIGAGPGSSRAVVAAFGTLAVLGGSAVGLAMLVVPAGPARVAAPPRAPLPELDDAATTGPATERREAAMTPLQDWFGSLFGLGGGYRDDRRYTAPRRHRSYPRSPFGDSREVQPVPRPAPPSTYRTMCVRLCDGYYFPISYSVSRERFAKDARTCESLCSGEARLFVYRNPGEEADNMEDLEGNPYRQLRAAFLYRTEYVPSCKCRPHPWEKEAQDRHRVHALGAAAKAADERAPSRPARNSLSPTRGGAPIMRLGVSGKTKAKPAPPPEASSAPSASDWRTRVFQP